MDISNNISGTEPVKAAAPKVWTSNYMKFLLDAVIFVGFWIAYNTHVTGRTVHEWFSMAFGVALLVHLGLSWRWVVNVAMRLFEKLPKMTLVGFVLNALLLLDFFMIMYTGLAMSRSVVPAFGLSAGMGVRCGTCTSCIRSWQSCWCWRMRRCTGSGSWAWCGAGWIW